MKIDYSSLLQNQGGLERSRSQDGPKFATEVIRRGIVTGLLGPGHAIRQDLIASALSLSKPPVREALRILEAEQLVRFLPNRGFVVAQESVSELREAWELRLLLEPAAMQAASTFMSATDIAEARALIIQLESDPEYVRHFDLNLDLHLTLYRASRRPHFLREIAKAHFRCERYNYKVLASVGLIRPVPDDHRHSLMVDMLEAGDIEGACQCLREHLQEAAYYLINLCEQIVTSD